MADDSAIRVTFFQSPQPFIRIHPTALEPHTLLADGQCPLHCGMLSILVPVVVDRTAEAKHLFVSSGAAERLRMREMQRHLRVKVDSRGVHFGPTVGILCNPTWNNKEGRLRQTMQVPSLAKLVKAGNALGATCYVFRLQDIDFDNLTVKAYLLRDTAWVPVRAPLPSAIYDQLISRKIERDKAYTGQRNKLSDLYKDRIFNDGFFDKWEVHKWLMEDRRMKSHVPQSIRYVNQREAANFLGNHSVTFLKPIHGSLGLGIIKFVRSSDGTITYDVKRVNKTPLRGKAKDALEAVRAFRGRLQARPYLIQQGIPLARYQDRPFDIRIVLQRDGTQTWKRTKMFARVAGQGDFASNLSSGGEALPVNTVLSSVFSTTDERIRCRRLLLKVAKMTTEVIENSSGKVFGELGIDLGVDIRGGVWVIEVNSKPWKSPVTEKGRQDIVDLAFRRPMEYAIQLAQKK